MKNCQMSASCLNLVWSSCCPNCLVLNNYCCCYPNCSDANNCCYWMSCSDVNRYYCCRSCSDGSRCYYFPNCLGVNRYYWNLSLKVWYRFRKSYQRNLASGNWMNYLVSDKNCCSDGCTPDLIEAWYRKAKCKSVPVCSRSYWSGSDNSMCYSAELLCPDYLTVDWYWSGGCSWCCCPDDLHWYWSAQW